MAKNLVSGTILALLTQIWIPKFFLWIWPLLDVRHCCKLSLYAIARKTNEPNLRNGKKPSFGILTHLAQIRAANVFSPPPNIWLFQSLDIMVSYHHVQYQKKLIIQSRENLVTDRWTDGQTNESDFIGRCPTKVECPI